MHSQLVSSKYHAIDINSLIDIMYNGYLKFLTNYNPKKFMIFICHWPGHYKIASSGPGHGLYREVE